MDKDCLERELAELELNAPRITKEHVENIIVDATYTILPSGKCMVCELTLKNGFTVRGEASVVSVENFREDIGKKVSYDKAFRDIYMLEGYLLQQNLYQAALNKLSWDGEAI